MAQAFVEISQLVRYQLRSDFMSQVLSIVLSCLLVDDITEGHDSFARLLAKVKTNDGFMTHLSNAEAETIAWSEFIQIFSNFIYRHRNDYVLIDHLKDLVSTDSRQPSEELFQVELSKCHRYLRIF